MHREAYDARMASGGSSIYIADVGGGRGWVYPGGEYRDVDYTASLTETLAEVSPEGTFTPPIYYGVDVATNGSGLMVAVFGWSSLHLSIERMAEEVSV